MSTRALTVLDIPRPVASVYTLPMSLLSMELSLSFQILMLLPHLIITALGSRNPASTSMAAANQLSLDYYARTCQNFEATVNRKIKHWISRDYTLAASLIRLHFHDCAVRGCDGSILLNHWGSERRAKVSETLRGFEVIDDIKAEVEKKCPKTVDILTAAARDATVKDLTQLGDAIQQRLYNFNGTGKPDPSIDAQYLNFLRRKCQWATEVIELDATTPTTFDSAYYKNLEKKMGLLSTDQLLYSDSRTSPIVEALATQPMLFYQQFAVSIPW